MTGRCKDVVDSAFNSKVVNEISGEQKGFMVPTGEARSITFP